LLFNETNLRAQLGKQAASYAKGFSWEIITRQITDVYQQLLSSRTSKS
jgi:glycosyltransferase involved in cell wall biosynthesis